MPHSFIDDRFLCVVHGFSWPACVPTLLVFHKVQGWDPSIHRVYTSEFGISLLPVPSGASILGVGGRDPQDFGQGGRGGRRGGCGWAVKYYYICYHVQEVCSEVVTFEDK